MNIKSHFLLTSLALALLGISIAKPEALQRIQSEERVCKLVKGKMDCVSVFTDTDYDMNMAQVPYSMR